jgi:hypothetical protein
MSAKGALSKVLRFCDSDPQMMMCCGVSSERGMILIIHCPEIWNPLYLILRLKNFCVVMSAFCLFVYSF